MTRSTDLSSTEAIKEALPEMRLIGRFEDPNDFRATSKSTKILFDALQALQNRHQVEHCIREMSMDLETSLRLQEELEQDLLVDELQKKLSQAQAALKEQSAIQRHARQEHREMADQLLKELMTWSCEHGKLKRIEQKFKELSAKHDEVVAKLLQKEMELEDAKQTKASAPVVEEEEVERIDVDNVTAGAEVGRTEEMDTTVDATDALGDDLIQQSSPPPPVLMPILESTNDSSDNVPCQYTEKTIISHGSLSLASPSEAATPEVVPPVTMVLENEHQSTEDDDIPFRLENLDNKHLMIVFSYLDALDILNMAQTNVSMYSRIDTMFGMGEDNDSTIASDDQFIPVTQNQLSMTTERKASTKEGSACSMTEEAKPRQPEPHATIVAIPPTPIDPVSAAVSQLASTPTRLKVDKSNLFSTPTRERSNSTSSVAAASIPLQMSGSFDGPRSLFASLLQPRKSPTSANSTSKSSSASIMNAAMASSMGAKLSDAELNAIITMTKRLKEKEALVDTLEHNLMEVSAKIEATEAVKQFLVNKCREMEESLAALQDHDAKVALQIASDQEVIAFLDGQVQELENEVSNLKRKLDQAVATAKRIEEQANQKSMVMGDMLQYEREKWQESEREWKATKKLLIKEVKNCRAQIVSLQAERDGYREQNERLKSAVLSSSSLSSPSSAQRKYPQAVASKGF